VPPADGDLTASGAGWKAIETDIRAHQEAFQGKRAFFTWQIARDFRQYRLTKHAIFWRK